MDQSALQDRGEMCTFDLGVNCPFTIEEWSSRWTAFSPKLHATITWRVIFTMWPSAAWRPSQWTSEQTGVITVSCSSTVPPSLPSSLPSSLLSIYIQPNFTPALLSPSCHLLFFLHLLYFFLINLMAGLTQAFCCGYGWDFHLEHLCLYFQSLPCCVEDVSVRLAGWFGARPLFQRAHGRVEPETAGCQTAEATVPGGPAGRSCSGGPADSAHWETRHWHCAGGGRPEHDTGLIQTR